MTTWRPLDHKADFAFEVEAEDIPSLLAAAVLAAMDCEFGLDSLLPRHKVVVELARDDPEMQLFAALSEVVFLVDARGLLPAKAQATAAPDGAVRLELWCDHLDPSRHDAHVVFKAPTLHGLKVEPFSGGVRARVVMDT